MNFKTTRLLLLIFGPIYVLSTQVACTTTLGAPDTDDAYDAESAANAMEEEEEEDAQEDVNR